ncbi:patatin-like phospholipase family protein [Mangrovibacterium diazotrophicum]|uniref:NTE family protein n=1 Tax=Mangrovibacterium diazotrophicum TaxID=1261403 RepID=A0A419VUG1_9BACT|nr:patatin-like phospholipase family protein [Mangrovibacterium diazotrophicum]RKD85158.1 NTE family protein [Mangrovibacterium diazotrophicum]
MKTRAFCLLATFILLFHSLSAQKVAVVLSGGGAKGLAHIGVIRALEENNIPIDYVAGTSMGAIVAGLYAAGYTPDQMEELFKSDQFKFWSTGKIQEEYRYYYSKLEESPAWLSLDVKKRDNKLKIIFPTNIIPEGQMDFAFMELFATTNAACNYDFNKLFVPFFCVATDAYNNTEVQLSSGDLGEAVRASMTIPFYFKPIEIDSTLVFDGGLVNNFPVKNVLDTFNPDVIIGHKVASNAARPGEDDIMGQIENLLMKKTDYEIPKDKGILIESTFDDIGLLDFDKIEQIDQEGYDHTMALIDSIKGRISRRVPIDDVMKRREKFNKCKPKLKFQNVQVEGVRDPLQRKYIIMNLKHRSDTIGIEELRQQYFKLVSDPQIKSIRPVSFYNPHTGFFDLHLRVKPNNQMEIQIGGNVSTKPINQGFLSLDYRFFKNRAYTLSTNIYFGRFYNSVKVGGRIDFPSKLPMYLSGYLTFNRWEYYPTESEFFFPTASLPTVVLDENNLRFELGVPVGTRGKLMLRSSFNNENEKYYLSSLVLKDDKADETAFKTFASALVFEENSFNNIQFADEGIASQLGLTFVTGEEKYSPGTTSSEAGLSNASDGHSFLRFHGLYDNYLPLSHRFTLGVYGEGTYTNKNLFSNYAASILSAPSFEPTPFSRSLIISDFRANSFVSGGLKSILRLGDQLHLRVEGYGFLPLQAIKANDVYAQYQDFDFGETKFMGLGGLVYQSAIGPVSLTANYFENASTKWFVVFSFGYVLFNKRGY